VMISRGGAFSLRMEQIGKRIFLHFVTHKHTQKHI